MTYGKEDDRHNDRVQHADGDIRLFRHLTIAAVDKRLQCGFQP